MRPDAAKLWFMIPPVSHCLNIKVNKTQTEQWRLNDLAKYLVLCEISSQTKGNKNTSLLFWISTIYKLPSV